MQESLAYSHAVAKKKQRLDILRDCLEQDLVDVQQIFFEAGCGHGHWLTNYARLHPHTVCVGIDKINKRIRKCQDKQVNLGLEHVFFYQADLFEFLEVLPKTIRLASVVMLFPDPWPKVRHHRRRMVQTDLLDKLAKRMSAGGRFFFRTDDRPYFEWTRGKLNAHPKWLLDAEVNWPHETVTYFQNLMDRYYSIQAGLNSNTAHSSGLQA